MKNLLIILSLIILSACGGKPVWYKKGVSEKDTHSYYQECVYNVGMSKVSKEEEKKLLIACMEKNGFRFGYY